MYFARRTTNDAICPPTIPSCNPSIGPGPAMVADQNANALIRQPSDTDTTVTGQAAGGGIGQENIIGIVVIVVIFVVLFSLWVGLAEWPRGKIKGWWRVYAKKAPGAETGSALAEIGSASAVDLTQADIEVAARQINASVAGGPRSLMLPAMKRGVSEASTVVGEPPLEVIKEELEPIPDGAGISEPKRAIVRESSFPSLPSIMPGSPFGSMRFKKMLK